LSDTKPIPNPVYIDPHRSSRDIVNGIQELTRLPVVPERMQVQEQLWLFPLGAIVDADPFWHLMREYEVDG